MILKGAHVINMLTCTKNNYQTAKQEIRFNDYSFIIVGEQHRNLNQLPEMISCFNIYYLKSYFPANILIFISFQTK